MACASFKASAPGSIMLMGEHAVLRDHPAMVMAIQERIYLTLTPRDDARILIHSQYFPPYETSLQDLSIKAPYSFVLAVLEHYQQDLQQGFDLDIRSEIDPNLGLGSSAAITVALIKLMQAFLNRDEEIWILARRIIRQVQGLGSGMDALASTKGGVIYYDPKHLELKPLPARQDLHLWYCGYKTPTAIVLKQVAERFADKEKLWQAIDQSIGECVREAQKFWHEQDLQGLADCMNSHQGLQMALGVSDAALDRLRAWLFERCQVKAAKISGSGLGDCILALGGVDLKQAALDLKTIHPKAAYIALQPAKKGVCLEP